MNETNLLKKQKELQDLALSSIPDGFQNRAEVANILMNTFVEITPPQIRKEVFEIGMLTISSQGMGGGKSIKPSNIYLNFEKLIHLTPDVILTLFGATGPTWILFFVALNIWSKIWKESTIELDQNHAIIMYSMWTNKDENNQISEENAFDATKSHFSKLEMQPLSKHQFSVIITNLSEMDCIEINEGNIWLREWVKTTY